jgi:hypothetical protein
MDYRVARPEISFGFNEPIFNTYTFMRELAYRLQIPKGIISVENDSEHTCLKLNHLSVSQLRYEVILYQSLSKTYLQFDIFDGNDKIATDLINGTDNIKNFVFYGWKQPIHLYTLTMRGDIRYKKVMDFENYAHILSPVPGVISYRQVSNMNLGAFARIWFYDECDEKAIDILNSDKKIRHAKVKHYKRMAKENGIKYRPKNLAYLKNWLKSFGFSNNTVGRLLRSVLYENDIYTIHQFVSSDFTRDCILAYSGVGPKSADLYFKAKAVSDKLNR